MTTKRRVEQSTDADAIKDPRRHPEQGAPGDPAFNAVASLRALALESFATEDDAIAWLATPHPLLGNESPKAVAETEEGYERVLTMLVALRYGGAA